MCEAFKNCMCAMCMQVFKEGKKILWSLICLLWVLELNLAPQEKKQVVLTAEPPLQSQICKAFVEGTEYGQRKRHAFLWTLFLFTVFHCDGEKTYFLDYYTL